MQLKSSRADAKTSTVTVNAKLADKSGGCVVWLIYKEVGQRVKLDYLFFGNSPTERLNLGDKVGRNTRANSKGMKSERPNTRVIPKKSFKNVKGIAELFECLFGQSVLTSLMDNPGT